MELKDEIPAWVQFEVRAVEDRNATIKNGTWTTKDVEFALITPPYSKDCNEKEVKDWLEEMEQNVRNNRMPARWRDAYRAKYDAWKKGLEIPEDGIPIKGWCMASPAQQQNLISNGIRTVESLAKMNDEGMKRYGMGALDMKNRAAAYLKQQSTGKVAQENAALMAKVNDLETQIKAVLDKNRELEARLDRERAAA